MNEENNSCENHESVKSDILLLRKKVECLESKIQEITQTSGDRCDTLECLQNVEYYAAKVNNWFNTRIEHDKSLFTLSGGAIGLLITLLSTTGIKSLEILIFYILSLISFITCLCALLWIFKRNSKYLEESISDYDARDVFLTTLDNIALFSFLIGLFFSAIIGILTAANLYTNQEAAMPNNKDQQTKQTSVIVDSVAIQKLIISDGQKEKLSVEGVGKMKPVGNLPIPKPTENKKK